uniref:RHS repeat domain-containing protein n=1 Tax=Pedobacter nototheniae TaxID=2488994 RepID=UPI0029393BA7
ASSPNLGEAISYDVMGNITSLTRDNAGTNNYTGYTGNQLTQISGFTNSSYTYNENGNLKSDSQKGINLSYNYLNLPTQVSGNQNITYTYNAAGQKLKKVSGINTTDYVAGIQYTNGVIEFIQTEEGVARRNGTDYSYEYNLTDHLGNVRATFYKNPNGQLAEVIQRDDYFAFGLRKMGIPNSNVNKYLYNGKELQEELGQYDYGARFYDPVIGRWNVVDPFTEVSKRFSPYSYAVDNPIRFIDVDGMYANDETKSIKSTVIDGRGNVIKHTNDNDNSIYQVDDPSNWNGSNMGLIKVGTEKKGIDYDKLVGKQLGFLQYNSLSRESSKNMLEQIGNISSALGTTANGAELFVTYNAGKAIFYTNIKGKISWISSSSVQKITSNIGTGIAITGFIVDGAMYLTGNQGGAKTTVHLGMSAWSYFGKWGLKANLLTSAIMILGEAAFDDSHFTGKSYRNPMILPRDNTTVSP